MTVALLSLGHILNIKKKQPLASLRSSLPVLETAVYNLEQVIPFPSDITYKAASSVKLTATFPFTIKYS